MSTLYRFSFEHEIVPTGITLAKGTLWSGFGRFGSTTTALVDSSSIASASAAITASLPVGTTGVRGSYYTKFSQTASYSSPLVTVGPFDFNVVNAQQMEIRKAGVQVATQDITQIVDNQWNLVRFKADFDGTGNFCTGSVEFNGINLQWTGATGVTSVTQSIIRGLRGSLSSLDDVGINSDSGSFDNGVPASIRGMVGGLIGDGDIQNWQQSVASLPAAKIPRNYQGHLTYIPKNNLVLTQDNGIGNPTPPVSVSTFTTIDAQTSVTRSAWTTSFVATDVVYSPYDHLVYIYGMTGATLNYAKYNPNTDSVVATGTFVPSQIGYTLSRLWSATYCDITATIVLSFDTTALADQPPGIISNFNPSKSALRLASHRLSDNSIQLAVYPFITYANIGAFPFVFIPPMAKVFYNRIDANVYVYCSGLSSTYSAILGQGNNLIPINPSTLFFPPYYSFNWPTSPTRGTASFTLSDINNSMYMAVYDYSAGSSGEIWKLDMNTMSGSTEIAAGVPYANTYPVDIEYSAARNAIYAVGDAVSYLFNPLKTGLASIAEYLPQIFNAKDVVCGPQNASIFIAADDGIYNNMGTLRSSVTNALLSPDSLKAGATASGDICTLQIAKPSGSFTSAFTYEGINVRIDNASSLNTASLKLGVRDGSTNLQIGSDVTTWGNSQTSAIRSVFSFQNSGSAKWTEAQFRNLQFYMEAGPSA